MAKEKIYLIEDDADFRELCERRLKSFQFQVRTFENASAAFKAMRSSKPDLVISDLKMEGLNGLEVCDLIRNNRKTQDTPIILMTGYSNKKDYVDSLNHPAIYFIAKPFEASDLLATIQMALNPASDLARREVKL